MDVNEAVAVVPVIQETTIIIQDGCGECVFAHWGSLPVFVLYATWDILHKKSFLRNLVVAVVENCEHVLSQYKFYSEDM